MATVTNPFKPLYERCNQGSGRQKSAALRKFPTIIDIELTNACNFSCLFCPTGNKAMRRRTGMMKAAVVHRIVEQARQAKHKVGLRFIGWGEPLMHPGLDGFIRLATRHGVLTHVNTNGSLLDRSNGHSSRTLIDAGLSSIKFSFQGVDRVSYREARNVEYFGPLLDKVTMFHRARGKGDTPWIQISTSTTYETQRQVDDFKRLFEPACDEISVGKTTFGFFDRDAMRLRSDAERITFDRLAAAATTDLKHPDPCPEVYDKLTIAWDGEVRVCCNDYDGHTSLGNVMTDEIATMWRHPTMEAYRSRLADGEYSGKLCSVCYDYAALTEGASAETVDG